MGWYFRRSARLGPFRINFSKSGVGYSVGGRGFRTGVSARGRRYSSVSIPGTGVGYRTSRGRRGRSQQGCLVGLVLLTTGVAGGVGLLHILT